MTKLFGVFAAALILTSALSAQNNAVVINPAGPCQVLDSNEQIVTRFNSQITATQNANNIAIFRCRGGGVFNNTGTARLFNFGNTGRNCLIEGPVNLLTQDWHETLSARGIATLICKIDLNSTTSPPS